MRASAANALCGVKHRPLRKSAPLFRGVARTPGRHFFPSGDDILTCRVGGVNEVCRKVSPSHRTSSSGKLRYRAGGCSAAISDRRGRSRGITTPLSPVFSSTTGSPSYEEKRWSAAGAWPSPIGVARCTSCGFCRRLGASGRRSICTCSRSGEKTTCSPSGMTASSDRTVSTPVAKSPGSYSKLSDAPAKEHVQAGQRLNQAFHPLRQLLKVLGGQQQPLVPLNQIGNARIHAASFSSSPAAPSRAGRRAARWRPHSANAELAAPGATRNRCGPSVR